ncbi:MAG TPA: hypothetical protein VF588_04920 [Pyrinomonadaceae bacterium]|jgi:hypothetical protein
MANAYFCNCVADRITVGLNNQLAPTLVEARAPVAEGDTNSLPMATFPVTSAGERESGVFRADAGNTVVIVFDSFREPATYEITVEESVAGHDLYFYVFEHTLVGQDQLGKAAGISIQAHETVKKLIQSGTETRLEVSPI